MTSHERSILSAETVGLTRAPHDIGPPEEILPHVVQNVITTNDGYSNDDCSSNLRYSNPNMSSTDHSNLEESSLHHSLGPDHSYTSGLATGPSNPIHPLHSSPNQQGVRTQQPIGNITTNPNSTTGSEVELARRLGVRFDSSNAAWVARWIEPHTEKKKSRWFSVAKYGELSARRLAIQACLQNMKPSEYPSLRDLHDVLANFATHTPMIQEVLGGSRHSFAAHGLVSGGELMGSGNPLNGRMDNSACFPNGNKQFVSPQSAQYHMPPFVHQAVHPFASIHPGVPSQMNPYIPPGVPSPLLQIASLSQMATGAMFYQGVPQHQAAPGFCLPLSSDTIQNDDTDSTKTDDEEVNQVGTTNLNGLTTHMNGLQEQPCESNWPNCALMMNQSAAHTGTPTSNNGNEQTPSSQIRCYDTMTNPVSADLKTPSTAETYIDHTTPTTATLNNSMIPGNVSNLVYPTDPTLQPNSTDNFLPNDLVLSVEHLKGNYLQSSNNSLQRDGTETYMTSQSLRVRSSSRLSSSGLETQSGDSEEEDDEFDGSFRQTKEEDDNSHSDDNAGKCSKKRKLDRDTNSNMILQQSGTMQHDYNVYTNGTNSNLNNSQAVVHNPYYQLYSFGQQGNNAPNMGQFFLTPGAYQLPMMPHHLQMSPHHATGFFPHLQPMDLAVGGLYLPPGAQYSQLGGVGLTSGESPQSHTTNGSPTSGASPGLDGTGYGQHGNSGSSGGPTPHGMSAKMTCERGLHYSRCYRGNKECWIAVWNTKGGRIMHEAFEISTHGFEQAKLKAREARDAAHSNNIAVAENSRPSWKSHSNTGIPHVSLDSQQLRFRAHKFGRRLCRSFSFGRRRGSFASRESAFDAAVLWLIQTPTEEEIAAVSNGSNKIEDPI